MVIIRVSKKTSRLIYVADLIFQRILGMNYQILLADESVSTDEWPILDYGGNPNSSYLSIPESGLLNKTEITPQKFEIFEEKIPYLFAYETTDAQHFSFDIFSATFYLVTEYEKWENPSFDSHGRYNEHVYDSFQQGWFQYPLVHLYAEELWKFLHSHFPKLRRERRNFSFQLTFDIDHPWKFLRKSLPLQIGGMGKDLLMGNWLQSRERLTAWILQRDPNQCFDLIFKHCSPQWTRFFFLIDRNSPYDGRFIHTDKAYAELIRRIQEKGYPVGIHPSYTSYLDEGRVQFETKKLQEILQNTVLSSRQHFLRYRLPDTFQFLMNTGIQAEYSLVNYQTGGFRTGMAIPYPWFDLSQNKVTSLILHPTQLMDVTLTQYLQLNPEEGIAYAQKWVEATWAVGGEFVLLMHNDTLSNSGMWRGWKGAWLGFIEELGGNVYSK